ncbi:hypothetical protein OGAPHI_000962 [Ogataea philodendri]|uniref:Uncharacterized protein n=1 Tax=Ogataea philodendri TaxID=1378263 RepID=A0A9P8PEM0_9ASCO|nr:uncharacterized protein OGAPHI_000962 [Ogataea philodendri]KAH3670447.1 hypothetical protein OGAPHI_000962 [Ogataea philodendri]
MAFPKSVDRASTKDGLDHTSLNLVAVIGSELIFEESAHVCDRMVLFRVENGKIGVHARSYGTLSVFEADLFGGVLAAPFGDVHESDTKLLALGVEQRQAKTDRGNSSPGLEEVASLEPLELGGAWRVVAHHSGDNSFLEAVPELFPVLVRTDRWTALELGGTVGDVLGVEREARNEEYAVGSTDLSSLFSSMAFSNGVISSSRDSAWICGDLAICEMCPTVGSTGCRVGDEASSCAW